MSCESCGLRPRGESGAGDGGALAADAGTAAAGTGSGGGWAGTGLSRRQFIEAATVAAIGGLLVACTANSPLGPAVPTGGPWDVNVSDYSGLSHIGGVARVSLGGGQVAGVGRVGANDYVAYGLACTHQGTQVVVAGDGWYCPNHGAEYNTAGNVTRGPASSPLVSLGTSYDPGTGVLTITGSQSAVLTGNAGDDDSGDDD